MNEFPFPPHRIAPSLVLPIHAAFVLLIVIAILGLILRCRRPAKWRDLIGWFAVFAAAYVAYQLNRHDEAEARSFAMYLIFVGLLTAIAVGVTIIRAARSRFAKSVAPRRFFASFACTVVLLELGIAAFLLLPRPGHPRSASELSDCKNRMKGLMFGLHNYEYTNRHFPPPEIQTDELPPRSWRVELLPWIGQGPLRKSYSNNDQWNGSQNSTLSQLMPYELACPTNPRPRMLLDGVEWQTTGYAMVKGPRAFGTATGRKLSNFPDGVANTVAVVEASGRMIPWLKPEDVEPTSETTAINTPGVAAGRSRGVISSYHPGGANIAMADGSVRFISERVDPKILQAILTADGGETPGEF